MDTERGNHDHSYRCAFVEAAYVSVLGQGVALINRLTTLMHTRLGTNGTVRITEVQGNEVVFEEMFVCYF